MKPVLSVLAPQNVCKISMTRRADKVVPIWMKHNKMTILTERNQSNVDIAPEDVKPFKVLLIQG